jgi:thiol-disulfide isomerase/thioredoxin
LSVRPYFDAVRRDTKLIRKEWYTVISTAMAALLQTVVLSASPTMTYEQAYAETEKTGKPLVVLIGADWCGACRVMKNTALPQVAQDAVFNDVAFTTVNTDTQKDIVKQVMQGGSIPQLVMFQRDGDKWTQQRLVGAQSPTAIIQFLRAGVKNSLGKLAGRE